MLQQDLDHGYVTARGVAEDYGFAVTADGRVVRPVGSSPSGNPAR
jgi:hypothetical protein